MRTWYLLYVRQITFPVTFTTDLSTASPVWCRWTTGRKIRQKNLADEQWPARKPEDRPPAPYFYGTLRQVAGSGLKNGLTPADPRQFEWTALHTRVGKQYTTQRARTQICQALQLATQGCRGNDGTGIDPGLSITEQVHLPDNRHTRLAHPQHACLIDPGHIPGLRQYLYPECSRAKPLQAPGQ